MLLRTYRGILTSLRPACRRRWPPLPPVGSGSTKSKHDGYRLIVQRDGRIVGLWTRNGHDWSGRFPLITEAALRNHSSSSFVIDGEAVLLDA